MTKKIFEPKLPRGLSRLAFRFPIWLYRAHMGWLLGHRFILLTHTGRKSGLPRQTVLEVVRYDPSTGICIVASGWGEKSDWFLNVIATPNVSVQIRNKRFAARAERLLSEDSERELLDYSRRHPLAMRELAHFMGYQLDGTEDDIRSMGQKIPMFMFEPVLPD